MTDMDRDELLPALRSAIAAAPNAESAMKQTVRLLKDGVPDYTWVGIYVRDGEELVLGPFLGKPSPHARIPLGQGICGAVEAEAFGRLCKRRQRRGERMRGPYAEQRHADHGR